MEQEEKEKKAMPFKNIALFIVGVLVLGLSGYLLYTLYGQNQNLQKELAVQIARFSEFEQELTKKGEKVQMQQVELDKLEAENKKLTAENKQLADEKKKAAEDLTRMQEDSTGKLNDFQKEKAALERRVKPLEQQIEKLKRELKEVKSQSPLPAA